jgi:hypothetical protein
MKPRTTKPKLNQEILKRIKANSKISQTQFKAVMGAAERAKSDGDLEQRRMVRLCKYCYYFEQGKVVEQRLNHPNCELCRTEIFCHNSGKQKLCISCAHDYGLCCYCSGDLQLPPVKGGKRG